MRIDEGMSIAISPDSRYMVTGSADRTVKIFDFQTRQLIHHFKSEHKSIFFIKGGKSLRKIYRLCDCCCCDTW